MAKTIFNYFVKSKSACFCIACNVDLPPIIQGKDYFLKNLNAWIEKSGKGVNGIKEKVEILQSKTDYKNSIEIIIKFKVVVEGIVD